MASLDSQERGITTIINGILPRKVRVLGSATAEKMTVNLIW